MKNTLPRLVLPLLLGSVVTPTLAGLFKVDETTYTEANGHFAAWYQDTHGRTLDLCLSKVESSRVADSFMCNLLPSDVFDVNQPIAFPANFPDEAFWFAAEATFSDGNLDLLYVSGLEAAFNGGVPLADDQVSFARIRIRVKTDSAADIGRYTVTHPYGVEVFDVTNPGEPLDINMTRDIGIGTPGDFHGALKGDIGPFLRSVKAPYMEINPDTGAIERFIGDPNVLDEVTGSPFGTNFVRIDGPNNFHAETRLFAITGKLSDIQLPTPLLVERATYSRDSTGTQVQQHLFVQAPPPPATVTYPYSGSTGAMVGDALGHWYGWDNLSNPSGAAPTADVSIEASNPADPSNLPSSQHAPLVDMVTISSAEYRIDANGDGNEGVLTVKASSSDESGQPALTATDPRTGEAIGALVNGELQLSLPFPPANVLVTSANKGSDTEAVTIAP